MQREQHTSRHRQRGFSFIEILIVMGIIGVLAAGITVAIQIWLRRGPEFATKQTISKTKLMIENWKAQFELYPPSDVTALAGATGQGEKPQAPDNSENGGIEAIYQALYWPGFKGDPEWGSDELRNHDEDRLRKAINKHGTPDLMEIVDAYENPLIYFHRDDYDSAFTNGRSYVNKDGEVVEARPYKRPDGSFYNPSTFQIWSMGNDGQPNTDDDILPWN
ncbi:MAG: type II secretion system protein [Planctomycetota bacterium]|nr:type II secretion system protein [Planctomycetota bacterium]